jgi:hypothetical protein
MTRTSIAIGLSVAVLVSAGCSMSRGAATGDPCPPRATYAATTAPTPTLAAGGKGVAPREVLPVIDEGVTPASERQLASGGRGVPVRMEASAPIGATGAPATPHLVAGPRGSSGPWVDCK